jgi:cytochrome c-type biogenesis protein CcmH/NrfG
MKSAPSLDLKDRKKSPEVWWICAGLLLAIAAAYWPVSNYAFTEYDDNDYIWQNRQVMNGLTWPGVVWAFFHFNVSNWHPLSWLSHMLDVQLFGLNAGAHHVVNVVFHAVNTLLLFVWLRRLTGFLWRSALVAALFALHPLHVESVAWVAERKDVLSTFFMLLTLMAYTRYAEGRSQNEAFKREQLKPSNSDLPTQNSKPKTQNPTLHSVVFYLLALICYALGLMSKPMLVTLPFVMLLLDYWPLERIQDTGFRIKDCMGLFLEKIPFIALSGASCVITFLAQQSGSSVISISVLPVAVRLQYALLAYAGYLQKMVWPSSLAASYPPDYPVAAGYVIVSLIALVLISVGVFLFRRRNPYLVTGWLWYLGTLVPVIGLVQVGSTCMADRYTYVPLIGIFIAGVWLMAENSLKWKARRLVLTALSIGMLTACWTLTAAQVRYWQNSETLARRALAVTKNNAPMNVLMGNALVRKGRAQEATQYFAEAARISPSSVPAKADLALVLAMQGKMEESAELCRTILKLHPDESRIHYLLANILGAQGKFQEAIVEYDVALRLDPEQMLALNDLAWLLATAPDAGLRDGPAAVRLAEKACRISGYRTAQFVGTLGAAYAEAGRFEDAVDTAQKALDLAAAENNPALLRKNRELLELYQQKKAYHEPGKNGR